MIVLLLAWVKSSSMDKNIVKLFNKGLKILAQWVAFKDKFTGKQYLPYSFQWFYFEFQQLYTKLQESKDLNIKPTINATADL